MPEMHEVEARKLDRLVFGSNLPFGAKRDSGQPQK